MSENPLEFGMVCVVAKLTLCYVFQRVLFFLSCTKIGWWPEKYADSYKAIVNVGKSQIKGFEVVEQYL